MPWGLLIFLVIIILLGVGGYFLYQFIKNSIDDNFPDVPNLPGL